MTAYSRRKPKSKFLILSDERSLPQKGRLRLVFLFLIVKMFVLLIVSTSDLTATMYPERIAD